MQYASRVVDAELDEMLSGLPAVSVEGVKGVGKTATATRRAKQVLALDRPQVRSNIATDPEIILTQDTPLLIDEWQFVPSVWDVVRRAVDQERKPGRFILTGSALPAPAARIHSGAGRIVKLVMRPMTLPERDISEPTVSLEDLLTGSRPAISGESKLGVADYAHEIIASGLPGIRQDPAVHRRRVLESYVNDLLERDIPELGVNVRRSSALRSWLTAYAAASATTTSYTKILQSATPGEGEKPAATTAAAYRDLLERIRILDPLPAWIPVFNPLKRLAQAPKHHLVDPAIAATLLGATESSLLRADSEGNFRHEETLLAALFESLATLSVRVFAQRSSSRVSHLRTRNGDHEIDLIVERPDHKVLALEVKLGSAPQQTDTRHLNWLHSQIGDRLLDKVILNTGSFAHRLPDGTAVVPLALLGI